MKSKNKDGPNGYAGIRVLVVGMADSIHLARWLSQFAGTEYDFLIVSSSPHRRLHNHLSKLIENSENFRVSLASKYLSLPLWVLDRFFSNHLRGALIALQASRFRPDFVHVLEFQNAGYAFLRARQMSSRLRNTKLLLTPYGSDLFWFMNFRRHRKRLEDLLTAANAISSECYRDEVLASNLGFKGDFLPRIPAFGASMPLSELKLSDRNTIAIRGYQNRWGQAKFALMAVRKVSHSLANHRIVVYSCNWITIALAKRLARQTGLQIETYIKGTLAHSEVQEILSESVVFIGLSKSDGISASMIEAMANGAVPIQSDTSCCSEWLENGVGGYLVKYNAVDHIAALIEKIISSPDLRNRARASNLRALQEKLEPSSVHSAALETYRRMN